MEPCAFLVSSAVGKAVELTDWISRTWIRREGSRRDGRPCRTGCCYSNQMEKVPSCVPLAGTRLPSEPRFPSLYSGIAPASSP